MLPGLQRDINPLHSSLTSVAIVYSQAPTSNALFDLSNINGNITINIIDHSALDQLLNGRDQENEAMHQDDSDDDSSPVAHVNQSENISNHNDSMSHPVRFYSLICVDLSVHIQVVWQCTDLLLTLCVSNGTNPECRQFQCILHEEGDGR